MRTWTFPKVLVTTWRPSNIVGTRWCSEHPKANAHRHTLSVWNLALVIDELWEPIWLVEKKKGSGSLWLQWMLLPLLLALGQVGVFKNLLPQTNCSRLSRRAPWSRVACDHFWSYFLWHSLTCARSLRVAHRTKTSHRARDWPNRGCGACVRSRCPQGSSPQAAQQQTTPCVHEPAGRDGQQERTSYEVNSRQRSRFMSHVQQGCIRCLQTASMSAASCEVHSQPNQEPQHLWLPHSPELEEEDSEIQLEHADLVF